MSSLFDIPLSQAHPDDLASIEKKSQSSVLRRPCLSFQASSTHENEALQQSSIFDVLHRTKSSFLPMIRQLVDINEQGSEQEEKKPKEASQGWTHEQIVKIGKVILRMPKNPSEQEIEEFFFKKIFKHLRSEYSKEEIIKKIKKDIHTQRQFVYFPDERKKKKAKRT